LGRPGTACECYRVSQNCFQISLGCYKTSRAGGASQALVISSEALKEADEAEGYNLQANPVTLIDLFRNKPSAKYHYATRFTLVKSNMCSFAAPSLENKTHFIAKTLMQARPEIPA